MFSLIHFAEKMNSIVTVEQGTLRGKECVSSTGKRYHSFEGIPYAKPPVGKLRFQDPQPPESWTGIRDATTPGNKCAQMDPYGKNSLQGSEDCLYLNVYTPVLPIEKLEKLPVVFFVHGGRYLVGCGDYYRPDHFIDQNVILVTINYRLHVLGFLCLHNKEAPGNAAFKDTIMALKWIRKNIKFFNGNETNVTAFGESAGAGLVTSYLTSKMADGLVHKIIAQSGVCLSDLLMIEEDPIEKAKTVASNLGHNTDDLKSLHEFLLNAPIEELVFSATMAEISRPPHIINAFFLPNVEKKLEGVESFFEEYPLVAFKENRYKKLPVLLGLNSHEGALFLRKDDEGNIQYLTDIQKMLPRYMGIPYDSEKSKKVASVIKDFYFGRKDINDETKKEYLDYVSDAYFNRDIIMFAEYFAKYCDRLFLYYFSYSGNMNTRIMKKLGIKGASHGDLIPYMFYRENKASLCDEKDMKIVDFISQSWCNFARDGVPTCSNKKLKWLPYNTKERKSMNIDEKLEFGHCPLWPRIEVWMKSLGERSKL